MMIRKLTWYFIGTCMLGLTALQAGSSAETFFQEGNEAFTEGKYKEAVELYDRSLTKEQTTAGQFNLGNAYAKLGETGHAILHYERVLVIDPSNPDAKANLAHLRKEADLIPGTESRWTRYASSMAVNNWVWLAALAFWVMLIFLLLPTLYGFRKRLSYTLAGLACAGFAACGIALAAYHMQSKQAVIIAHEASIKITPTPSSNAIAYGRAGEIVTLDGAFHEPYARVETAQGQTGWIEQSAIASIWQ
ncbi:MAG TPA: hypothetical protein DIU37_02400 [Opitutae bacterium]|nr:hypothetical protein [Opitutae bacterium]|tara:strand:+ start:573 stop:1316 length:744 start_codon:yes stop_codon:yes gene_type:complete